VGHGIHSDLEILRELEINFHQIHTIVGIVDTQQIGKVVLGKEMSLENLVTSLGCPYEYPKNAGNNAYLALRALFLLTYQSYTAPLNKSKIGKELQNNLLWMRNLAFEPVLDATNKSMEPVIQKKTPDAVDWTDIVEIFGIGKESLF